MTMKRMTVMNQTAPRRIRPRPGLTLRSVNSVSNHRRADREDHRRAGDLLKTRTALMRVSTDAGWRGSGSAGR